MLNNPTLYEINTRIWIKKFDFSHPKSTLRNIPITYWKELAELGIEYVWLMGVWQTCNSIIDKYCFEDFLKKSYSKALKDWKHQDVAGSPYSINDYIVNPLLGTEDDLLWLKDSLNQNGIKLILDFVPNHFSAGSVLLQTNPEIFLSVSRETFRNEPHTFFQPRIDKAEFFAHGRDPFFPAWQDTVQVNISNAAAREFLIGTLLKLTRLCDGVRCDMAMLALNNVFKNTWAGVLSVACHQNSKTEFWSQAVSTVKKERNDFLFLAEAYWDLEWQLQQLGFDYTYDKRLTDRLKYSSVSEIAEHLKADNSYQQKSIRFLENHDEERILTVVGKEKSKAAAIVVSTLQGMRFYYDGQFEGKRVKIPVQITREPEEKTNTEIQLFYAKLLKICSDEVFKKGSWKLLKPISSWDNSLTFQNMLAWEWQLNDERRIIVINYSEFFSTCRIKLNVTGYSEELFLKDLLNDIIYNRSAEEINSLGLYIELKPWQAHIFSM
ncbi:MAG: alpha amylase catalytic region [Ignavibacteria bacterium]|nr:MAG: alpha amylase catalytic region [Ignavibacteria bacterium]KAF0156411.1 MAG: alpha amylase catalytic region [Ignavibacteria bacterium]